MANRVKVTTLTGKARFLCIGREETYENQGTGKQTAQIVLAGAALTDLKQKVDAFVQENFTAGDIKKGLGLPFKETKDGEVFVKAKAYFKTKEGRLVKIPVADKDGQIVIDPPEIGNGSLIRLRIALKETKFQGKKYVGVDLIAIQLIKLVENADAGFEAADDEVEGGFSADEFAKSRDAENGRSGPVDDAEDDDDLPF